MSKVNAVSPGHNIYISIFDERVRQEQLKAEGKFSFSLADMTRPRVNGELCPRIGYIGSPEKVSVNVTHAERLAVLGEEFGEVSKEVNEGVNRGTDLSKLRTELIQTAACCVAWLEALDKLEAL